MGKDEKGTGPTEGEKEKIKFSPELAQQEVPVRPPGGAVQWAVRAEGWSGEEAWVETRVGVIHAGMMFKARVHLRSRGWPRREAPERHSGI